MRIIRFLLRFSRGTVGLAIVTGMISGASSAVLLALVSALLGGRIYFLVAGRINSSMDRPFMVPRSLRAVDLKTGTTLWEQPVGGKVSAPPPSLR